MKECIIHHTLGQPFFALYFSLNSGYGSIKRSSMFTPRHYGLYFSSGQVEAARRQPDQPPLREAWAMLRERQQQGAAAAQWAGFRYLFNEDAQAGADGIKSLIQCISEGFDPQVTYMQAIEETLTLCQAFEILRGHPAFEVALQMQCLDDVAARLNYLDTLDYQRSYVESLWQMLLHVVAGVVLEREGLFTAGVMVYQRAIHDDIHPQGYIGKAVEPGDGGGLLRQLLAVEALVLAAEAASCVGVDLWSYSYRQVSVMTAASYLLYYYFFPDKWRWDNGVSTEPYQKHGGFFEMINHHTALHDLQPILDELRPIYEAAGGGLTTLSHGVVRKRGLFR